MSSPQPPQHPRDVRMLHDEHGLRPLLFIQRLTPDQALGAAPVPYRLMGRYLKRISGRCCVCGAPPNPAVKSATLKLRGIGRRCSCHLAPGCPLCVKQVAGALAASLEAVLGVAFGGRAMSMSYGDPGRTWLRGSETNSPLDYWLCRDDFDQDPIRAERLGNFCFYCASRDRIRWTFMMKRRHLIENACDLCFHDNLSHIAWDLRESIRTQLVDYDGRVRKKKQKAKTV